MIAGSKAPTQLYRCSLKLNFLPEKKEKPKDDPKDNLNVWIGCVCFFFVNTLFQAHRHEETLKEKVKENRLRHAAMAKQRKIENEELEAR